MMEEFFGPKWKKELGDWMRKKGFAGMIIAGTVLVLLVIIFGAPLILIELYR